MNNKIKHLEFIQAIINRMSGNSFLLKGWSITVISAMFVLVFKDPAAYNKNYAIFLYVIIGVFWLIDGYYLSQERKYRALYNKVRIIEDESKIDFNLSVQDITEPRCAWYESVFSKPLLIFYMSFLIILTIIIHIK